MTEKVRIDYIIRPENPESPCMVVYAHFAEPIVCRDGENYITDLGAMTVEQVRADGDD